MALVHSGAAPKAYLSIPITCLSAIVCKQDAGRGEALPSDQTGVSDVEWCPEHALHQCHACVAAESQ